MLPAKKKKSGTDDKIAGAKKKKKQISIEKIAQALIQKENLVKKKKESSISVHKVKEDLKEAQMHESRPQSQQAQNLQNTMVTKLMASQSVAPTEIEEIIQIQPSQIFQQQNSKNKIEAETDNNIHTEMDDQPDTQSCKTIVFNKDGLPLTVLPKAEDIEDLNKKDDSDDRAPETSIDQGVFNSTDSSKQSNSSYQLSLSDLKNMVFDDCPLPILPRGRNYEEGMDLKWRIKRLKQNHTVKLTQKIEEAGTADTPEQITKQMQTIKKMNEIQNTFDETGKDIKIANQVQIRMKDYPRLFTYRIYDSFRPSTLAEMRSYMTYLTKRETYSLPTQQDDENLGQVQEEEISSEQKAYLQRNDKTNLPEYVDQSKLLQFDGNFESGNIDSVYVSKPFEYNVLLKVDTNTKGNTHWFYFKVLNWGPKTNIGFNILNISRDMSRFYDKGMKVLTCTESSNGRLKSPWQFDECVIEEYAPNEIVRCYKKDDPQVPSRYYSTLKFSYKFPDGANVNYDYTHNDKDEGTFDDFQGTVICFAYGLPYTYNDLQIDQDNAKRFLIRNGGNFIIQQQPKETLETEKEKEETKEDAKNTPNLKLNSPRQANEKLGNQGGSFERTNDKNSIPQQYNHQPTTWQASTVLDAAEDGGRKKPTKQQLAQKDMKLRAAQQVKDHLNKFEMKLMNHGQCLDHMAKDKGKMTGGQKIEIVTDYLYFCQEVVSQSMGGLNIFQLTFTKRTAAGAKKFHKKKCLYIQARLHAAETHGSYIMKYLIKELTENHQEYDAVLSNYIIKLVPMLNPDGVTIGNSRSSIVGIDLNRRWSDTNPIVHPEIHFLKKSMILQAKSEQGISIFCDLHGHNRKENCFFYGCNKASDEGMLSWTKTRLLPKILDRIESTFEYNSCRFKQDKFKLNTARVVVWNELQVTNSFCLETSQYGFYLRDKDKVLSIGDKIRGQRNENAVLDVYNEENLANIGKSILQSLTKYVELETDLEKEYKNTGGWLKPNKLMDLTKKEETERNNQKLNRKPSLMNQPAMKKLVKKNNSSQNVPQKGGTQQKQATKQEKGKQYPAPKKAKTGLNVPKQESDRVSQTAINERSLNKQKTLAPTKNRGQSESKRDLLNNDKADDDSALKLEKNKNTSKSSNWRDFFAAEEIQAGLEEVKKSPEQLQALQEESSGASDSEPSVDNFDDAENIMKTDIQAIKKQNAMPKPPSVLQTEETSRLGRDTELSSFQQKRAAPSPLTNLSIIEKEEIKTPGPGRQSQTKKVTLVKQERKADEIDREQVQGSTDKKLKKSKLAAKQAQGNRSSLLTGPIAQMISHDPPEFRLQSTNFNFTANPETHTNTNINESAGPPSGISKQIKTPPVRLAQPEYFVRQQHQMQMNSTHQAMHMPQGSMSQQQQNLTKHFLINLASPHGQGAQHIHRNQLAPPYVNFQNQPNQRANVMQGNLPFGSYINVSNLANMRGADQAETSPEFFCTGTASFKFKLVQNNNKNQQPNAQNNSRFSSQPPAQAQGQGPVTGMVQGLSPQQMPAPGTETRERSKAYHKAQRGGSFISNTLRNQPPQLNNPRAYNSHQQNNRVTNLNQTLSGINTNIAKLNAQKAVTQKAPKLTEVAISQLSKRTTTKAKSDFNVNQSMNFVKQEESKIQNETITSQIESPKKVAENIKARKGYNYSVQPGHLGDLEQTPPTKTAFKQKANQQSPLQMTYQNPASYSVKQQYRKDDVDDELPQGNVNYRQNKNMKQPNSHVRYGVSKKNSPTQGFSGVMMTEHNMPAHEEGYLVSMDHEQLSALQNHKTVQLRVGNTEKSIQNHIQTTVNSHFQNDQNFVSPAEHYVKQQRSLEPQSLNKIQPQPIPQFQVDHIVPPIFNSTMTMPISHRGGNKSSYNQRQNDLREGNPISRGTRNQTRGNYDQGAERDNCFSSDVASNRTASQAWNSAVNQASDLLPQVYSQINQGLFSNAKKAQAAVDLIQQVYASQKQDVFQGQRLNSPRHPNTRLNTNLIQTPLKKSRVSSLHGSSQNTRNKNTSQSGRQKRQNDASPTMRHQFRASSQNDPFEQEVPIDNQQIIYTSGNPSAQNSQYIYIDNKPPGTRKSQNSTYH